MREVDLKTAGQYQPKAQVAEVRRASEDMAEFLDASGKNPEKVVGVPTKYWPLFNRCFGGLRPELITITAETGNGKSTWARNWFLDCLHQKIPSCIFSLEEGIRPVFHHVGCMEVGKPPHKFNAEEKKEMGVAMELYPFYYVNWRGMIQEKTLTNTIHFCIDKLGIKFFVVDHLDYIEKEWGSRNESYVIGDSLRRLAAIAHDKEVTIVLIVHPSKLNVQGTKRREVGIDDLKGSSSIKQESDAVFSIFRETDGDQETILRFLKIRSPLYSKFLNTSIRYQFDLKNLRFEEKLFDGGINEA